MLSLVAGFLSLFFQKCSLIDECNCCLCAHQVRCLWREFIAYRMWIHTWFAHIFFSFALMFAHILYYYRLVPYEIRNLCSAMTQRAHKHTHTQTWKNESATMKALCSFMLNQKEKSTKFKFSIYSMSQRQCRISIFRNPEANHHHMGGW